MSKAYFCYERNLARQWKPVIYFDYKPAKGPNALNRERTAPIELEVKQGKQIDIDALKAQYPAPIDPEETA